MSDQCGRCELRGKLQDCLRDDCFQHDNWFTLALQEQLAEKEKEIERLKELNDKFMWQVRDTCARAEKAESENAALRGRLEPVEEVYKKHEVWAREWLSTAPVSSRSRMLEFWQAICKTMEGK